MRRLLTGLAVSVIAVLAASSCGGGDDKEKTIEFPEDTFGIIDGRGPDGVLRPVQELWDIPGCTCDKLITNTTHGTRIRILRQKPDCPGAPYEVEIIEGPKAGIRGWVWPGLYISFDGETPEPSASG